MRPRSLESWKPDHLIASFCSFSTRSRGTVTFALGLIWTKSNFFILQGKAGALSLAGWRCLNTAEYCPVVWTFTPCQFWSQWCIHWRLFRVNLLMPISLSVERSHSCSCTSLEILHWNGNKFIFSHSTEGKFVGLFGDVPCFVLVFFCWDLDHFFVF